MTTHSRLLFVSLLLLLLVALPAQAQTVAPSAAPHMESLSTLPESELVIYLNASRILNDAVPRLVPEKELQSFFSGLDQMKAIANVDLRKTEYVVIAMRFNKLSGGTAFPIPDVMLTVRGDFDAKTLISMGMMMSEGKLREEQFGSHTIYLLSLNDVAGKNAANNPFGASFSQLAITTLDAQALAIGTADYVKAALDAVDGRGRIKTETIASLLRDPNALMSSTGKPFMAFAKSFGLRMAENPDPNCMTNFGDYYMSLSMGTDDFKINGAMNADNPETAGMMKNMLSGLLQQGKDLVTDKGAKSMADQVKLISEGSEVLVEAKIPQEMAVKFVREMLAPPPKSTTSDTKTVTKPASKSGKPRRRT